MNHSIINKIVFIILTVAAIGPAWSQDTTLKPVYRNGVSLEFLGTGSLFSLNYERYVFKSDAYSLATKAGIGVIPGTIFHAVDFYGIPTTPVFTAEAVNILGRSRSKLEIGAGVSYIPYFQNPLLFTGRIGYRYDWPKCFFRIAATPLFPTGTGRYFFVFPMIGIGVGRTF